MDHARGRAGCAAGSSARAGAWPGGFTVELAGASSARECEQPLRAVRTASRVASGRAPGVLVDVRIWGGDRLPRSSSANRLTSPMERTLEPEWLDTLPEANPEAVRSRRDLQRVNHLMGNAEIVAQEALALPIPVPTRIYDLGAGDGSLTLEVARKLRHAWPEPIQYFLLDQQELLRPEVKDGFKALNCSVETIRCSILDWVGKSDGPTMPLCLANLFLHHFSAEELGLMFSGLASRCASFVACEPRRASFSLLATKWLWMLGCNRVTRHDAVISVRAGFAGRELSLLWPEAGSWRTEEKKAGLFSHAFSAWKLRP